MKIFAIRDRLVDYYMTPFCAESTKQVLASLAGTINNPENLNAIAQTPQHFEVWQLGEVNEDTGDLQAKREYIADCSSLVRASVRADTEGRSGAGASKGHPGDNQGAPGGFGGGTRTVTGPLEDAPRTAALKAPEVRSGLGRVPGN